MSALFEERGRRASPLAAITTAIVGAALVTLGCGGKVTYVEGSGGAGPSGSSSSSKSSNSVAQTSSPSVGSTGSGQVPSCLDLAFGGVGQLCNQEGAECAIPSACCEVHAFCKNGEWIPETASCNQPCIPCGDGAVSWGCDVGAVCVVDEFDPGPGGAPTTYQCAPTTCVEEPLGCSCGAPLCQMNFLDCVGAKDPTTLVCSCFECDAN